MFSRYFGVSCTAAVFCGKLPKNFYEFFTITGKTTETASIFFLDKGGKK